jgi:hypothetical protein
LVVGEVHTSLLQTSAALSPSGVADLLALVPGEPVRSRSRPFEIAWSPDLLTGVDCAAPLPRTVRRTRLVGTLRSTVSVTEGRLLQVATSALVERSSADSRRPWSHYLAKPGTVELLGSVPEDDLMATELLRATRDPEALDITALNGNLLHRVQQSPALDRRPPLKVRRTQVRWVARAPKEDGQRADFTIGREEARTLYLEVPNELNPALSEFCSDLALHDWLLSNLRDLVDRALAGASPRRRAGLGPIIENLIHLWMPGTRVDDGLSALWAYLENRARLATQWQTAVTRIHDYNEVHLPEVLTSALLAVARAEAAWSHDDVQER